MSSSEKPSYNYKRESDLSYRLRSENVTRYLNNEKNPCTKEHDQSYQCLDDNAYDRQKCGRHFLNYKRCQMFWHMVVRDRKKKGIEPFLPAPVDRDRVKQLYKQKLSWE